MVTLPTREWNEPFASAVMQKVWMAGWKDRPDRSLTADELLSLGREILDPLFHEPPFGPVPDHLDPHFTVHGCVAEYEDRLEEIDRWKALELQRWLSLRAGSIWYIAGKVFLLHVEKTAGVVPERLYFLLTERKG